MCIRDSHSGAGKSTLIRLLNRLEEPDRGSLHIDGVDVLALRDAELRAFRQRVGMIFQHFNLLSSKTVAENVAFPLRIAGWTSASEIQQRVQELLALVGLADQADKYPSQLSGGQKQRVGIARALASRPQVLLSDEATSALDPETTRSILALLQQINRELGLTVVLITHQMQVIKQVAHRVAVMDAGQIVEQGETLQVFSAPQHETTRSLLDDVVPQELPAPVLERVRALLGRPGQAPASLLRLVFAGSSGEQPLLADLVRRFGVDLNIVHGQIDEVQGHPFGTLAVLARGAHEQVQAAIGHLRGAGVLVQELPSTEVAHA